ncbi:MAG: ABC transporter permease, partial [Desulfobacterales bacterium]
IVYKIVTPILDVMQTMPAFVYLIPAIPFFGLGAVGAIFSTVVFSIPPCIRLTCLGIRQVPKEMVEAADAFGSSTSQKLFKVQLPIAKTTMMAGINQTIMLALSMVVIAAMIGAGGLGGEVWRAIQRLQMGRGFEAGIGIVIVAIILDRVMQAYGAKGQQSQQE